MLRTPVPRRGFLRQGYSCCDSQDCYEDPIYENLNYTLLEPPWAPFLRLCICHRGRPTDNLNVDSNKTSTDEVGVQNSNIPEDDKAEEDYRHDGIAAPGSDEYSKRANEEAENE